MSKPPMDHKILRPFRYTPANSTNIARRFKAIQRLQRMKARRANPTVTSLPLRKVRNA